MIAAFLIALVEAIARGAAYTAAAASPALLRNSSRRVQCFMGKER
jgi:hypothetical protein